MGYCNTTGEYLYGTSGLYCSYRYQRRCLCLQYRINIDIRCVAARSAIASGGWLMMELIERREVASQKVGVRLYFSQIDLVILILVPNRRNGQPLVLVGIRGGRVAIYLPKVQCMKFIQKLLVPYLPCEP